MIVRYHVDKRLVLRYSSAALLALLLLVLLFGSSYSRPKREGKHNDVSAASHHGVPTPEADIMPSTPGAFTPHDTSSDLTLKPPSSPPPGDTTPPLLPATLPPSQIGKPQLHIVVAHHSEEPYWMRKWIDNLRSIPYAQKLGIKVIIYTKGPTETDLEALKQTSGAEEVVRLPNVGREGGTYLYHLLSIYDDPPLYVMFTQSVIKKGQQEKGEHTGELQGWLYDRLKTKFESDTGFMSLDRKHDICHCGHCTDMGREDFYPLWPQIYALLEGTVCQELEGDVLSFNGHFIVSKRRIVARPKGVYVYLKELVEAPEGHWIHDEPEPRWFERDKGKSVPSSPKFGHTLERLWHVIFSCDNPAEMVDCDLKGMKAEGPGGCTCKDFPLQEAPNNAAGVLV